MPPGRLPGEVFRACPSGRRPPGRPRTRWRDYVSRLVWERLGIPPDELEEVAGEREWAHKGYTLVPAGAPRSSPVKMPATVCPNSSPASKTYACRQPKSLPSTLGLMSMNMVVSRSRMGGRAFSYQVPLLWNQLPVQVSPP
ncbi:hypothetical protein D4764_04G0010100 [Takifugu flavidus]|uniref:Uncharacterized protein n=1 Tax=Takifugu flavidus TaxID=433684 RepID=A0A5C6N563_9TELE|nr:hypothetical protein D4764_04G0010100 [Takifugu flavidus]